jgi:hypothetical protein
MMVCRAMRILIRNILSGQYYEGSGKWTNAPQVAHDFGLSTSAMEYVFKHHLNDVEIVFEFDDPKFNFTAGPMNGSNRSAETENA